MKRVEEDSSKHLQIRAISVLIMFLSHEATNLRALMTLFLRDIR